MNAALSLEFLKATRPTDPMPVELPVSRSFLASAFASAKFNRGAEIGVWEGSFSEKFCQANKDLLLICVDPWSVQKNYPEAKNDAARLEQAYQTAKARLKPYGCVLLRMTSEKAAANVPDRSLDFVYIDGNHTYDHVIRDLELWTPKVRQSGVVSGHDYGSSHKHKPFIQVKPAVDKFTQERGIAPWFVLRGDKSASFMWIVQ